MSSKISNGVNEKPRIVGLTMLLLLILIGSAFIYFFTKVNKATSNESLSKDVVIEKGWSVKQIAAKFEDSEIINNPFIFTLYVYSKGASGKIQAGEYVLDRKMSIAEIVEIISKGKVVSNEHRITLIEGWNNKQIASYLAQRNIFTEKQFLEVLENGNFNFKYSEAKDFNYEGFLFPDTYTLAKNASVDVLVSKMLKNFELQLTEKMIADIKAKKVKLSDIIIIASIVEKEVGRNKEKITAQDREVMQRERELVASVFYNRLERGMPLQSDATVNYITGKTDRQATLEDIKIKSPYNTYVVKGLPPGPIGNPGLDAIKAAIYPTSSDYLYFLNKTDGEAVFGKTIEEHNANRAKYLD